MSKKIILIMSIFLLAGLLFVLTFNSQSFGIGGRLGVESGEILYFLPLITVLFGILLLYKLWKLD